MATTAQTAQTFTQQRQTAPIQDPVVREAVRRLDTAIRQVAPAIVPTGTVLDWRGGTDETEIPLGWLWCTTDPTGSYAQAGSAYLEADTSAPGTQSGVRLKILDYPALFAVLQNRYGGKFALGEFRLPDESPATRIIKT